MRLLGERQVVVDCDVLQADGGTRTALDLRRLRRAARRAAPGWCSAARSRTHPLHSQCAAITVGVVDGMPMLDLPYVEDSTRRGRHERGDGDRQRAAFVEVQGTAEGSAFTRAELDSLLGLADGRASTEIMALQTELLAEPPAARPANR